MNPDYKNSQKPIPNLFLRHFLPPFLRGGGWSGGFLREGEVCIRGERDASGGVGECGVRGSRGTSLFTIGAAVVFCVDSSPLVW